MHEKISDEATNYTAELIAMRNVLRRVNQEENSIIVTDSLSAMQALKKTLTRNPLVKQFQAKLADRCRNVSLLGTKSRWS